MTLHRSPLLLAAAILPLLPGCAAPVKPAGVDAVRADLIAFQNDPTLGRVLPLSPDVEAAMQAAEIPTSNPAQGEHLVYLAERKVSLARANAERHLAQQELDALQSQRMAIQADARDREAEIAKAQAEAATTAALVQQQAAQRAQMLAVQAQQMTEELRRQMTLLEAQATDRGMVMTLGDVLFATGKADLTEAAKERLDKLAAFMHRYTDRTLVIEGHTDTVGGREQNQLLSQRRAEAVKVYLIVQSVDAARLTAVGRGVDVPTADNDTPEGRQRNRRVEIIIQTP
jgi:outer membrane protein OmpA-like peptidoglycan-associated protein